MRKNDIVDHIVNTTTLSRSQAIAATESIAEAISQSLIKVASLRLKPLLQNLKKLVTLVKVQ